MQDSTIEDSAGVQESTGQCRRVQESAGQCRTVQFRTVHCWTPPTLSLSSFHQIVVQFTSHHKSGLSISSFPTFVFTFSHYYQLNIASFTSVILVGKCLTPRIHLKLTGKRFMWRKILLGIQVLFSASPCSMNFSSAL